MKLEEAFGQVLRELRLKRGLSQEALALEAGVQRNYISLLERGQNAASLTMLFKLAGPLEVTVSALMADVEARLTSAQRPGTRKRGRGND